MTEKMKPSGIGWIKDIPESWKTSKVKFLATEPGTLFLDGDWIESDVIEESGIRYLTSGNVGAGFYKDQGSGHISEKTFNELHCLKVFPGDLMISRLNEPIGRACIVPEGEPCYVVAVDNVILRPNKEYDRKFIMYAMNTEGYAEHGNMIARGATMSRVSRSQLGQFWLAFPGITEQSAIADFLDAQCAKIDSVIADIEKQIETLQRYKKALITEAVTKGLDRSVPMRDSGIDWIGKIPDHWDTNRLRYVASVKTGPFGTQLSADEYVDEGVPIINVKNIGYGSILAEDLDFVPETVADRLSVHRLKINDIVFGRKGAVDKHAIITDKYADWVQGSDCIRVRSNPEIDSEYLNYLFDSTYFGSYVMLYAVGATMPSMSSDILLNARILVPPVQEQKDIAAHLNNQCGKINDIIANKKEQLAAIRSHKKSMIYEYVTGKKRVTEVS